jgi:hypothetical protein
MRSTRLCACQKMIGGRTKPTRTVREGERPAAKDLGEVLVNLEPVREHAEDEEEHGETCATRKLRTRTECVKHAPKSMIADITLAAYQISPASGETSLCAGRLKHTSV